jgi:AcrR family transcriptional regulator
VILSFVSTIEERSGEAGAVGESKGARTRRALIQHLLDVIAESGEFTADVVAERAGLSTAAFYAHFATKDRALAACLDASFSDYAERMARVETIEHLLDHGLEETLRAMVTTLLAVNAEYLNLLRLARSRVQSSEELRDQSRRGERSAFASTARLLQLAQAAGRVRAGDVEVMTATVRTVLQGLDSWMVRSHPAVAADEVPRLLTTFLAPGGPHDLDA